MYGQKSPFTAPPNESGAGSPVLLPKHVLAPVAPLWRRFSREELRFLERSSPKQPLCSTLLFWVNWIHAIIIFIFLKNVITIQLTMFVSLQFRTCLKNAIMYARSRMWPTCRRIRGGHIFVWT
jgi:hypothetical protein